MFKTATAVALAVSAVVAVSGISAGAVVLQKAFEVDESPARPIDAGAVTSEAPDEEPTPEQRTSAPTPTPVPIPVPVVAAPLPVGDDAVGAEEDDALDDSVPDVTVDATPSVPQAPSVPAAPVVAPRDEIQPDDDRGPSWSDRDGRDGRGGHDGRDDRRGGRGDGGGDDRPGRGH